MAIKPNALAKGDSVIKLIELITGVNTKRTEGDTALQAAINEVREMFKTDELTEVTSAELADLVANAGLEPGHKYKVNDLNYNSYVGGEVISTTTVVVYVSALDAATISDEMIVVTANGVYHVNGRIENATDLIVDEYSDGWGNKCNFIPELYSLPNPGPDFCNNTIMFAEINGHISAPAAFYLKAEKVKGNTIITPKSFNVHTNGSFVDNKVGMSANVSIFTNGNVQMNDFGTACTVSMSEADNTNSTADVANNTFGDSCTVIAKNMQLFQMNKVGVASSVEFNLAADGNEIAMNCSNIKISMGMRNFFNVQCANISLNGSNAGCSGNRFGFNCGASNAITLADGCGGNTFGDQCDGCTLGTNVLACELEGFNRVSIPAGFQGYSIKRLVGYTIAAGLTISKYKTYTGQGFRINVGYDPKGKLIYWTDDEAIAPAATPDTFTGSNKVTALANIPVNKSTVLVDFEFGGEVSFEPGLADGREVYVVARYNGHDATTVTFPGANVESVTLTPNQRVEFSVISIAGEYFVRVGIDNQLEEFTADETQKLFE